jgi:hypothetical protein
LPPTSGEAAIPPTSQNGENEMATRYLSIFAVVEKGEGDEKKSHFTRVGAAFPHRNGEGFNLVLELIPAAGQRLVAMPPRS